MLTLLRQLVQHLKGLGSGLHGRVRRNALSIEAFVMPPLPSWPFFPSYFKAYWWLLWSPTKHYDTVPVKFIYIFDTSKKDISYSLASPADKGADFILLEELRPSLVFFWTIHWSHLAINILLENPIVQFGNIQVFFWTIWQNLARKQWWMRLVRM